MLCTGHFLDLLRNKNSSKRIKYLIKTTSVFNPLLHVFFQNQNESKGHQSPAPKGDIRKRRQSPIFLLLFSSVLIKSFKNVCYTPYNKKVTLYPELGKELPWLPAGHSFALIPETEIHPSLSYSSQNTADKICRQLRHTYF